MWRVNIKDIARLAGVSASTVSKILNNKAESISEETRQRVLETARQYHYTPYSGVKTLAPKKQYLLGLVCAVELQTAAFIENLEQAASQHGYNVVLFGGRQNVQTDMRNLHVLEGMVDGVLYVPWGNDEEQLEWLRNKGLPTVLLNADNSADCPLPAFGYDYFAAGNMALQHLMRQGHRQIGFYATGKQNWQGREVRRCLESFYSHNETSFDGKLVATKGTLQVLLQTGITALLCETLDAAADFYRFTAERNITIPREISLMALSETEPEHFFKNLSVVCLNVQALARQSVAHLVEQIEAGKPTPKTNALVEPTLRTGQTVQPPARSGQGAAPVVVVGTLNEDIMLKVPMMPTDGETVLVESMASVPGGKGANQAVCIAKLGGEVALIGRIGNDAGGKMLYNALRQSGVNTRAISVDRDMDSGKAFLNVTQNGDSFIEVYAGANMRLEQRHIQQNEDLFAGAKFCLVQTELPPNVVEWVLECAQRNNCPVICKPCSTEAIPDAWLKKIYVLAPNEKEANRLAGSQKTLEQQARWFLQKGCPHVVITLAERGCYYASAEETRWYPAYLEPDAKAVDTSGASDAFLGALALYLAEGHTMHEAIRFAHVAAGISVTREGVQASLPDRVTMEIRKRAYMEP